MKLSLRKVKAGDQKYFLKWWSDPYLISMTSGQKVAKEELVKFFKNLLRSPNKEYVIMAGLRPIGHVSLAQHSKNMFRTPIVIGEAKYRGRGIGTRVLRQVLAKGFKTYDKAYLEVRPENRHAKEVYQNLGYKKIRVKVYKNNPFQPKTEVMVLTKRDFKKNL